MMSQTLQNEDDIYLAICKIKYLMNDLPFSDVQVQCVVVSLMEICRNALIHGGGTRQFICERVNKGVRFIVSDHGTGIHNIEEILNGHFESDSGLGLGISVTKRLMDEVRIDTSAKGTKISAIKRYD